VRVGLWSAAAVALAATLQRLLGPSGQALAPILSTCALLLPILLLTHAVAAVVETRLRRKSDDAALARDVASRTAATGLALLGAVPLWLGPVADLLSARHDGLVDAIVGISPLTHLAVASGNDLLRNDWLYEHANLAALPVAYPGVQALAGCYGALCLVLGLVTLMRLRAGRMIGLSPSTHPIAENTP
jgi:diacylglycerol kinase